MLVQQDRVARAREGVEGVCIVAMLSDNFGFKKAAQCHHFSRALYTGGERSHEPMLCIIAKVARKYVDAVESWTERNFISKWNVFKF